MGVSSSTIEKKIEKFKEQITNKKVDSAKTSSSSFSAFNEPTASAHHHPVIEKETFETFQQAESVLNAKYNQGHSLGRGSSAEVYLVYQKGTNKPFACKKIIKGCGLNGSDTMKMEVYLMQILQHRHIVQVYEIYECPDCVWLIMEYAEGGDLSQGIASLPLYNEEIVAKYFKQILFAVKYLHSQQQVVHRDLKLGNILFTYHNSEPTLKLTDFGLSTQITPELARRKHVKSMFHLPSLSSLSSPAASYASLSYYNKELNILHQRWGTPEYFAPEVYAKAYGYQADIWSLGCILYELLTGELAFPVREIPTSKFQRYLFSSKGKKSVVRSFASRSEYQQLSDEAKVLIEGMLHTNPKKRFDIEQCLVHPFFTSSSSVSSNHNASKQRQRHLTQAHLRIKQRVVRKLHRMQQHQYYHQSQYRQLQQQQQQQQQRDDDDDEEEEED